ncbi:YadA-like family protein, partial [Paraburkholderia phytofirmans]|uniref:YadA family autotransporter adhesin n=1 Tax=Paraburkholderia phytofirmans TaxID=261302 RepID=UPI0038BD60B2
NSTLADSSATGTNSLAAGPAAVASAADAVALGNGANAGNAGAVALGAGSTTTTAVATSGTTIGGITYTFAGSAPSSTVSVGSVGNERTITNVAAGRLSATSTDAVNGSELFATNQQVTQNTTDITTLTTNITNGSVGLVQQDATTRNITVAKDTDGTVVDFTGSAGTRKLTGVSAGDVNATSVDAVNGSQLYALANSTANAMGGGSTVNPDGSITPPSYVVDGNTYNNVGGAITNIDGRVTNINNTVNNIVNGGGIKYFHANSTLADSSATGTDAVAIGGNAQATAANSVALGLNSTTTADLSAAGYNPGSTALAGTASAANGEVSVGSAGAERRITNVAAGSAATDAVNVSQLMSEDAKVNAAGTSTADALGGGSTYNTTTGAITNPTYVVDGTTVHNVGDAITNIDDRTTQNTTNIANLTNNINNGSVGLVQQDATTRNITVAKDTDGTVVSFTGSAGTRKLTGVSAGDVNATSVDAVNGSQLYALASSTADAMGGGSTVNPDGSITAPSYVVDGTTVNNVGDAITNIDGRVTQNTTDITNINNTLNNISSGGGITYFHANSNLADSQATGMESVAIGGNAQSLAANSVALGSNSVADRSNTVSVGSAGNERQITNVAAGTADTDAVNVAQLKASGVINPDGTTNTTVTYDHNADGTTNYNSVTMGNGAAGGTTIHNVAAGTAGDDAVNVNQMNAVISTVTNIATAASNPMFAADGNRDTEAAVASGTHSTAMGANAKATGANSVALGAGSVADRDNTVSVGSAGNERQVTNVAAGTATTDAVNVGQLNDAIGSAVGNLPAGMTAKDYTDKQISSVQNSVSQVAKSAYAGIAAATALTMIPDVDQGKTIAVGIGGGTYKGEQAVALGVSARITENLKMKVGAGTSSSGTTVGLGASYQW